MTSRVGTASLEFLRVTISTDPTSDPTSLPVSIAVPSAGTAPTAWITANWELGGPPYVAAILVGPTIDGSDVQLSAGAFDVWVKIEDVAETPAFIADRLVVFDVQTSFASVPELADELRITLDAEDAAANQALRDATAFIRAYTNQQITLVLEEEFALDGTGRLGMLLPEIPVVSITEVAVLDDDGSSETLDAIDYRIDGAGILWKLDSDYWPLGHANVIVTYDHGYATVPEPIVSACLDLAATNYATAQTSAGGVTSKQLGSFQVTYDSTTASDSVELPKHVRIMLDRYRVNKS